MELALGSSFVALAVAVAQEAVGGGLRGIESGGGVLGAVGAALFFGLLAGAAVLIVVGRRVEVVRRSVLGVGAAGDGSARLLRAAEMFAGGERRPDALRMPEDGQADSSAWNAVVAELDRRIGVAHREEILAKGDGSGRSSGHGGAFDAIWHGVLVSDEHGLIVDANPAAGALLGMTVSELRSVTIEDAIEGADDAEPIAAVARGQRPQATTEITREEGGSVLRISARALRESDQGSAIILVEDVTQQRAAEESRGKFVSQAAHELRTPLTNIRLIVEDANESDEGDALSRARALQMVAQESRRLERTVSDMLSASELDAGVLTIRRGEITLRQVFEDLREDYRSQAEERSIELKFDVPPKYPRAFADRDKLVLALHNVVGNALKYTDEGGSVTVVVEADDERLTVIVSDTGMGISPEDQPKVFDRFYRAGDDKTRAIAGTGLGLAITRDIVRMHGGEITLESEPGQGSVFTIVVPIAADGSSGEAKQAA